MIDYPIVCLLGRRGSGKTLFAVRMATEYFKNKVMIFSNITSLQIPNQEINFSELASFPEYLHDAVIFMDEMHIGTDSYNFWKQQVKDITTFVTQLRKRRLTLYYITQNFTTVAKRLRDQTDYIFQCSNDDFRKDIFRVEMFDKWQDEYLGTIRYNGKPYYDLFNTNELILNE